MFVIKMDGSEEKFKKSKIYKTCIRAGQTPKNAKAIANKIEQKVSNGTSTMRIYKMIIKELEKVDSKRYMTYRLREAIAEMTPEGFEIFAKRILENLGYRCSTRKIIKGQFVDHEVDVVAVTDNESFLVEVKRHKNPHRYCGLGTLLEVWGRFDDINKRSKKFKRIWMFINTKFSEHAIRYAKGKKIRLTGWKTGSIYSLENLIEPLTYPVTILNISSKSKVTLQEHEIVTIGDLIKSKNLPIRERVIARKQATDMVENT